MYSSCTSIFECAVKRLLIDKHPCCTLISQAHTLLRGLVLSVAPLAAFMPFSVLINQPSSVYRKHCSSLVLICQLSLNIVVIAVLQVYTFFTLLSKAS